MNESEDRPISSDRPAPYGEPPEERVPPAPGGPPAEPAVERVEPFGPPPAPLTPPPPVPAAPAAPAATAAPVAPAPPPVPDDVEEAGEYDDYDDEVMAQSRWISLLATVGTALIGIVTVQVLTSLVEGFSLKSGQRVGIPDDLLHRLGYPFGGLGATALVFLVLGVVLVSMPSVLDELLSESQDRVVGIALIVAIVMGVIIALGSLLAVRANLHEYAAKNVAVPSYVRVQFTNFLLGALGAAALTLFGAIAAINERSRERYD